MFAQFLHIVFSSLKLDKSLYKDSKYFGEAAIYFAGLIMILDGIAGAVADNKGFSIAGGGETIAAIDKFGVTDDVSYISTGGGAFLEYVQGEELPGVRILKDRGVAD